MTVWSRVFSSPAWGCDCATDIWGLLSQLLAHSSQRDHCISLPMSHLPESLSPVYLLFIIYCWKNMHIYVQWTFTLFGGHPENYRYVRTYMLLIVKYGPFVHLFCRVLVALCLILILVLLLGCFSPNHLCSQGKE